MTLLFCAPFNLPDYEPVTQRMVKKNRKLPHVSAQKASTVVYLPYGLSSAFVRSRPRHFTRANPRAPPAN